MKDDIVILIEGLLKKAGDAIMEVYSGSSFDETQKLDLSPVTRADHISSHIINEGLNLIFPYIPVIDEENPIPGYTERKSWTSFFLLDPLDGTKEFIKRNDEFCINLALLQNNQPVMTWIYQPVTKKGWSCIKGKGIMEFGSNIFLNNKSEQEKRTKLKLVTSRSHSSSLVSEFQRKLNQRFEVEVVKMGSALKQVEIALGNSDIYVRGSGCSEWDTAAGHLMIEESGGKVLQWDMASSLMYNKINLKNTPFVMLSKHCQHIEFMDIIKVSLPFVT